MRIPRTWVPLMAKRIAESMVSRELIKPTVPMDKFITHTESILLDELTVEDRLNDEVRELLKKHESEIEKGRMDYRKVFDLTKQKLVRERNLVL